jgi:hypothetical protein
MSDYRNIIITENFLDNNPNAYFVFGDNLIKQGYGGAAILRDHPRAIGFITKKFPDNDTSSFYTPSEYEPVFLEELQKLENFIEQKKNKKFYISQLGAGLANKFYIWEKIIEKNLIKRLSKYHNVIFCWDKNI